jgi:hypothetical protein
MATLDTLATVQRTLVQVLLPLGPNDGLPIRKIYAIPEVCNWIDKTLPNLPREAEATLSPQEEFSQLLFHFISSKGRLRYNKNGRYLFRDMVPASDEAWELITYQLRIFGWFYRKDQFVAAYADRAVDVKRESAGYRVAKAKVLEVRQRLDLDEPRFIGGVITNVITI